MYATNTKVTRHRGTVLRKQDKKHKTHYPGESLHKAFILVCFDLVGQFLFFFVFWKMKGQNPRLDLIESLLINWE